MPHDVIARVNDIGQSQGQPSLLTFQDRHGNSMGEDDPDFSPPDEITGVPDTDINAQYASDINPVPATTTTDEYEDNLAEPETEDNLINNDTVDTVENEINPPRCSNRVRNPRKIYEPSFAGKRYAIAAANIGHSFAHSFATVHPDAHMPENYGVDWDHIMPVTMTQLSMKAGLKRWGQPAHD